MTDTGATSASAWAAWPIDREIVLARVLDAPREAVFDAWTDPAQITAWFGPAGMTIETHEIDIRPGGVWRFDMVAADGTRFDNRMVFHIIDRPHRIEADHGADRDDDPGKFRMLVTFDEQSDGRTVLTLRQLHPSRAQREATIGFGAVGYGGQTLDKLAAHIATRPGVSAVRK